MIGEAGLRDVGIVFAALGALVLAVWLAHSAWATRRVRQEARRRPEVLRVLAAALLSGDRGAALAALDRLGGDDALDLLVEMALTVAGEQRERLDELALQWGVIDRADRWSLSRRWSRRLRAARLISLFGTGDEEIGSALLRDEIPDVRAQAAEWAGAHPNPAQVARLIEMLGDLELGCRFAAREALIDAGPAAIVELVSALPGLEGPALAGALEAAASIAVPDFLPPAIGHMRSPDPDMRALAAGVAGATGGRGAVDELERLTGDPDPDVRAAAAAGLGNLGRWEAAASIAGLLEDSHWRTRRAAALSLRRMGPTGEVLLRRQGRGSAGPAADTARSALELPPAAAAVEEDGLVP